MSETAQSVNSLHFFVLDTCSDNLKYSALYHIATSTLHLPCMVLFITCCCLLVVNAAQGLYGKQAGCLQYILYQHPSSPIAPERSSVSTHKNIQSMKCLQRFLHAPILLTCAIYCTWRRRINTMTNLLMRLFLVSSGWLYCPRVARVYCTSYCPYIISAKHRTGIT